MINRLAQCAVMSTLLLSGCVPSTTTSGLCDGLRGYERAARAALLDNAASVPEPVGEAVTDLIIGLRGGCGW